MFRLYPIILIIQIFCFYHILKHSKDYKWIFIVAFFPLIGAIIYAYIYLLRKDKLKDLQTNLEDHFQPNAKIQRLKKAVQFSDTINNRMALANAYLESNQLTQAIHHYRRCQDKIGMGDVEVNKKLMQAYYLQENYSLVVRTAEEIESDPYFNKSKEKVLYAHSLALTGNPDKADHVFQSMNHRFSNYYHRIEYYKFLEGHQRMEEARQLLDQLMDEIAQMDRKELQLYRREIVEIRDSAKN